MNRPCLYTAIVILLLLSCNDHHQQDKGVPTADSSSGGDLARYPIAIRFDEYPATIFTGKQAHPDFSGNAFAVDEQYVRFIKEGCRKNGINFAGHYTIVTKSCGAMCVLLFIVDRVTGKIYTDTGINEDKYGFAYRPDSRLLIANASSFPDKKYEYYQDRFAIPELYVWDEQFQRLDK